MIRQRPLGKTGINVSEISLGGLFVASFGAAFDQANAAVRRAFELGMNYVDTAPGYGDSEEVLGKILPNVTQPFILSTKLGGRPNPFDPRNPDALKQSVETSLKLLNRDRIDILMIHEPDRPGQYDWWSDPKLYDGPVMNVLDDLKRQGVIRFTGLGGTTAYEIVPIMKTGRFDVVLTAFNYSLLWREAEIEVLPTAKTLGMGVIIGSPLQQGALARRHDEDVAGRARWLSPPRRAQYKALYTFLDEIKMPIAELALRFIISNPDISCLLSGSRSVEEVEQNVAAVAKGPLPKDVMERLSKIAAMVPFRPYEEPFGLPWGRELRGGPGWAH